MQEDKLKTAVVNAGNVDLPICDCAEKCLALAIMGSSLREFAGRSTET